VDKLLGAGRNLRHSFSMQSSGSNLEQRSAVAFDSAFLVTGAVKAGSIRLNGARVKRIGTTLDYDAA